MKFLYVFVLSILFRLAQCTTFGDWEALEVEQSIELNKVSILQKTKIIAKNVGDRGLLAYYIPVPKEHLGQISFQSAALSGSLLTLNCGFNEEQDEIAVIFTSPIEPNQEVSFMLIQKYNKLATLAKNYLEMGEDQHLIVPVYDHPASHYPIRMVSTTLLGAAEMQFIGPLVPEESSLLNIDETSIGMGPYFDLEATSSAGSGDAAADGMGPKYVKYLYNFPLTRVTKLEREVWVSHWANTVQFEEHYDVINDGGALANGFSRAEWMMSRGAMVPKSALVIFDMAIPEQSSAHYYTDVVGMITTWKYVGPNHLILKPRFPLFGGWMANFTVGWTNSLSQFSHVLDSSSEEYILSVPLLNGPSNTIYDEMDLKVYLPEGAKIVKVYPPSGDASIDISHKKSYFDMKSGHVETTIKFHNINDEFNFLDCYIHYQYTKTAFYAKPLSIATYVFIGLLSFFTMKRIDFSIERKN